MTRIEQHRANLRRRLRDWDGLRPGPDSVSWRVNRELIVIAGWGRAVLLQLAHPLVAAGVAEHSRFDGGVTSGLARLRSTIGAMLALTFGDEDAMVDAAARINAIHDRVSGTLPEPVGTFGAGTGYSAHDAALLRWVHATLLDSIPRVYEQLAGPLTPADRDRYCVEAAVMGPLLDIPPPLLPRRAADVERYVHSMIDDGVLGVTAASRTIAHGVLFPAGWRLLWPVFRPVQLLTIGSLPPKIRDAYGFAWTARHERALARWTWTVRTALGLLPDRARHWPASRTAAAHARHVLVPTHREVA